MPFVAIPMIIVTVAYSVIIPLHGALASNKGVAYFAVVLAVIGIYPIQAAAASWNANNLAPSSRVAIGIALNNCVGNAGGIVGSFMYLQSEQPKYYTGFGLSLAFGATGLIVALLLEWIYIAANSRKAKIAEEAVIKYTDAELFDMGDSSPKVSILLAPIARPRDSHYLAVSFRFLRRMRIVISRRWHCWAIEIHLIRLPVT